MGGAPYVQLSGSKPLVSYEGTATTTASSQPFACKREIIRIANDGNYDIQFCLDATIGSAGTFTVKAGQSEDHIPIACSTLYYQSINGSSAFRAMGV